MKRQSLIATAITCILFINACSEQATPNGSVNAVTPKDNTALNGVGNISANVDSDTVSDFKWQVDRFADTRILRYQVPGFESLPLNTKALLYYLYKAGLSGRDITWDQNYRYNLLIRETLEAVIANYKGDKNTPDFLKFNEYVKRVWFASGIHHHYMSAKFEPEFSRDAFTQYLKNVESYLPLQNEQSLADFTAFITPILFNKQVAPKMVNQSADIDNVVASSVNYYEGVTEQEVSDFYEAKVDADSKRPISWGLNSKLIKQDGKLVEKVWKLGGMYDKSISEIVFWLEKAITVAENTKQQDALKALVKYYRSGDLNDFDDYSVKWVKDVNSDVDVINGFIEVYDDPLAYRGAFESVVSVIDHEATKVIAAIAEQAQWFEDNSPLIASHKKTEVKGITGRAINVVGLAGDCSPTSPIGINLPNANWIRAEHGSKSVSLTNIVAAYDHVRGGAINEFAWDEAEVTRVKTYGPLASHLHTDLHEVVGHASGKINEGVGTPKQTLKQYASALEEGRADLIALYYLMDNKLVDMGIMPNLEVGKASYDSYIRHGMMQQLRRLKLGESIEEAHMRNRQLIAQWVYEKGLPDNIIEKRLRDGKTFFVVNDYQKLRGLFGELLRELQRIKSEGDFTAGQALVENYGVKVDHDLHVEVLERYKVLNIAPYSGFINPKLEAIYENEELKDVVISYPDNFQKQMLDYSAEYGFLPLKN